jgi:putative tryptophan/tyrosine transport system substrate-binding protein
VCQNKLGSALSLASGEALRRRDFIMASGATVAWSLAARAQASRRLGILAPAGTQRSRDLLLDTFGQALQEHGWNEGQNVLFEYRSAEGNVDALTKLAAELVQLRVDVILTDGTPATDAARKATRSVPIVMAAVNDPVASGFVASLSRPGGNITGLSLLAPELAGKRLQLLAETVPKLARVAVLANPSSPATALLLKQTEAAAQTLGIALYVAEAATPDSLETAFAAIASARAGALLVMQEIMLFDQHPRIVAFAAASRLPALFPLKQVVEAGGLMAYGPNILACFRQAAAYVDKIFRGANPADLPVETPTTFELAINLKTARALGLTIPPLILTTADVVIE